MLKTGIVVATVVMASGAVAADRDYDFAGFDRVDVREGVTVSIAAHDTFAVHAQARHGNLSRLEMRQVGDRLIIGRSVTLGGGGLLRNDDFHVTIGMPMMTEITATSGATVVVDDMAAIAFEAVANAGADLEINGLVANRVVLEASAGAEFDITGTCQDLRVEASTGANLDAEGLVCDSVSADATSGASVRFDAEETAVVSASFGASLVMHGGADVTAERTSMGASFRHK